MKKSRKIKDIKISKESDKYISINLDEAAKSLVYLGFCNFKNLKIIANAPIITFAEAKRIIKEEYLKANEREIIKGRPTKKTVLARKDVIKDKDGNDIIENNVTIIIN